MLRCKNRPRNLLVPSPYALSFAYRSGPQWEKRMGLLRLIGNILWFVFGGFFMGLAWCLAGLVAFISIVGIPWGRACFVIGGFSFWPFGREPVSRSELTGREDIGTGPWGTIGNLIWFFLAGWWLALGHLVSAALHFITIIGIPFGIQHVKLAVISLWPIGVQIVPIDGPVGPSRFVDSAKTR